VKRGGFREEEKKFLSGEGGKGRSEKRKRGVTHKEGKGVTGKAIVGRPRSKEKDAQRKGNVNPKYMLSHSEEKKNACALPLTSQGRHSEREILRKKSLFTGGDRTFWGVSHKEKKNLTSAFDGERLAWFWAGKHF